MNETALSAVYRRNNDVIAEQAEIVVEEIEREIFVVDAADKQVPAEYVRRFSVMDNAQRGRACFCEQGVFIGKDKEALPADKAVKLGRGRNFRNDRQMCGSVKG